MKKSRQATETLFAYGVIVYTQQKESKRKNRNTFFSTLLPLIKVQDSQQPDCNIYFSNCK
jgi:hypothetical protein